MYLLDTSNLKKDICIFGINHIYLSFHFTSYPCGKLPRCIIKSITSWLAWRCWKDAMLILKQKPWGWAQHSDKNQPPLRIAVPKYCVLSKYPILMVCWKLIKYSACGKTSTEKIPLQNPTSKAWRAPHFDLLWSKDNFIPLSFSWLGMSALLNWEYANSWEKPRSEKYP